MNSLNDLKGNIKELLDLEDHLITDVWGIWLQKYPFEFDDKSLKNTNMRIIQLLNKKLIKIEDGDASYTLSSKFDIKWMYMLEYLILSRKLSNYMGYVQINKPNYAANNQIRTACEWEHYIEYCPLDEKRSELSCPIFGHNCPSGKEKVKNCKLHEKELRNKLQIE